MAIEIWTDGSCWYKDGCGGWAFVVVENGSVIYEDVGFKLATTSAVMEMTAILEALRYVDQLKLKGLTKIVTDYEVVVKCFEEHWHRRWVETDWYGTKNTDLWKEIIKTFFNRVYRKRFVKVKGHSGIEFNERADFLAGEARKFCIEINNKMIEDVVLTLADKFPEHNWDLSYDSKLRKYCIFVDDFDFYFKSKKFKNITKVLRKKYPDVEFFCAYKKITN